MGGGNSDHDASRARSQARKSAPTQQVFTSDRDGRLDPGLDPYGLLFREARDSENHPASLPVALMLDITGSMGDIPRTLAYETLPVLAKTLQELISDAQMCFGAVGDADDGGHSAAPWQLGQFESDVALADTWLTKLFLRGSGGSAPYESYDLALYFLARLTRCDHYEKRGQKGYAFIIGDDICRNRVYASTVNRLLGRQELSQDVLIRELVAEVLEKWHLFVLIPDHERARQERDNYPVGKHWECVLSPERPLSDQLIELRAERMQRHVPNSAEAEPAIVRSGAARVVPLVHPTDAALVVSTLVALGEGRLAYPQGVRDYLTSQQISRPQIEQVLAAVKSTLVR